MPLRYLIDEHLRGDFIGALRAAGLARGVAMDLKEVGGPDSPPLSTLDPQLLLWCESNDRVLISRDFQTMSRHLDAHLSARHLSPGIFLIRSGKSWPNVLDDLVLLAEVSQPDEWRDRITYIPL